MSMKLICPGSVAIIDPVKKFGEAEQYVSIKWGVEGLDEVITAAIQAKKEIRYYYKGLEAENNEAVASQVIVTEIPPHHVQPFHSHKTLHEMTIVEKGTILAVDHESMEESELQQLLSQGRVLNVGRLVSAGSMVIEGPGTRHTIVNPTKEYGRLYTIQTARMSLDKFPADWHRDGK